MTDTLACPICTMDDILEADFGVECGTCGHEWYPESSGIGKVVDANGNELADGDDVVVVKDLPVDGKAGGIKIGTKVKGIRLVEGDHPISGKVNGRNLLIIAEFVKKA